MTLRSRLTGSGPRHRILLARGVLIGSCGIIVAACGSTAAPVSGQATGPAVAAPSGSGTASTAAGSSGTTGSGSAGSGSTGSGSTGAGAANTDSSARVSLTVVLSGSSDQAAQRWTLTCNPAGGTYPDAATACTRLLKLKDIFGAQPTHVMCPMIMANARSYLVSGTFLGKPVHQTVVDGGCSLTRWSELHKVFSS